MIKTRLAEYSIKIIGYSLAYFFSVLIAYYLVNEIMVSSSFKDISSLIFFGNIESVLLMIILVTGFSLASFYYSGSLVLYLSLISMFLYIATFHLDLTNYMLMISLLFPGLLISIPIIVIVLKGKHVKEPLVAKSIKCMKYSKKTLIIGFVSGLGIGFSLLSLAGLMDSFYPDIKIWLLGAILTALFSQCIMRVNPILAGIITSLSIIGLPLGVFASMVSPLKREGYRSGSIPVIGELHYWSVIDSVGITGFKSLYRGRIDWHWVSTAGLNIPFKTIYAREILENRNTIIAGKSGYGKSTLAKHIINEIKSNARFVVIDFHGEYSSFLKEENFTRITFINDEFYLDFNSIPGGAEYKALLLADAIKSIYKLGEKQYIILYESLLDYFSSDTSEQLVSSLQRNLAEEAEALGYADKTGVISLIRYLSHISHVLSGSKRVNLLISNGTNLIFDLSMIPSKHLKTLIGELIMRLVYNSLSTNTNQRLILVVEEAHNFTDSSILGKLFSEGRKFGLSTVSITQVPSKLPKEVISNTGIMFVFRIQEPIDLEYVSKLLSKGDKSKIDIIKATLSELPQYHFITDLPSEETVLLAKLYY